MHEFKTKLAPDGKICQFDCLLKIAYKKAQQLVTSRIKKKSLVDELVKMRKKDILL